jgi:DHA2 family methylenomycin A resistance protein-like MFS transporter
VRWAIVSVRSGFSWQRSQFFTLASLACALAPTAIVLLAARAMQGLGAAILVPNSLALLIHAYPDEGGRGRAVGIWAAGVSVALISGPLIGGGLIALVGWRSILVNLPIGFVGLRLSWGYFTETPRSPQHELDFAGPDRSDCFAGLSRWRDHRRGRSRWSDAFVIAGFVVSAVLAVIFVSQ